MRLSGLHLMGVLSAMFLVGPSGCGPASPSNPTNVESQRGRGELSLSAQPPVSDNASTPSPSVASPVSLASGRSPAGQREARPAEPLVVPDWMAAALKSPDVDVRLQALDRWVQQGRIGAVDPLMLAMNDPDERVRTRALQLIEQDWVQAAEK